MKAAASMRRSWIAAAFLTLAAAAATSATPQSVSESVSPSADDFIITGSKEGDPLALFVAIAAGLTEEPFFVDADEVRGERIHLEGTRRVPRAKFMAFFDSCIRSAGFDQVETMEAGVRVHRLVRNWSQGHVDARLRLRTIAQVVDPTDLPRIADRQTLVTTTFTCKNLSARELVTTLQIYFEEPATEFIRNLEGTGVFVMTGPAAHVAEITRMCERLDRDATGKRYLATDELEQRLAALEAQVAELTPTTK